jgi:hypothetical protein
VFVFAVQTCREPAAYDPLDDSQWEFYVVPSHQLRECGYKSVTISWARQRADAVPLAQLAAAIDAAAPRGARARLNKSGTAGNA